MRPFCFAELNLRQFTLRGYNTHADRTNTRLCFGASVPHATATSDAGCRRRVVVLGSTGSVGTSCLDVIAHLPDRLEAWGLCAQANWEALREQVWQFQPAVVALTDGEAIRR